MSKRAHIRFWEAVLEHAFKTNEQWGERESRARVGKTKEKRMGRGKEGREGASAE